MADKDLYHSDGNKSYTETMNTFHGLKDKTVFTKPNRHGAGKVNSGKAEPGWNK